MKNKVLYIIGAILLLLIITNPTVKAFKDYLGRDNEGGLERESNFFICSVYHSRHNSMSYLGIVGNFFNITSHKARTVPVTGTIVDSTLTTVIDNSKIADSAKMADSSKH